MKFWTCNKAASTGRFVVALLTLSASASAFAGLVINSNYVSSAAGGVSHTYGGLTFPASQVLTSTAGGGEHHTTSTIDYGIVNGQTVLRYTTAQGRGGAQYTMASLYNQMEFTVDANTAYALSGLYTVDDTGVAGRSYFVSHLYDLTTNNWLVHSSQDSFATVDETFALGDLGGDSSSLFHGSLEGQLTAGHRYRWQSMLLTQAYPDEDSGSTATGHVQLLLGSPNLPSEDPPGDPAAAVPEPATSTLLAVALAAAALARRRRPCRLNAPAMAA